MSITVEQLLPRASMRAAHWPCESPRQPTVHPHARQGPAQGGENLGILVTFSQTRASVPIAAAAVHAVRADRDQYNDGDALVVLV